MKNTKIQKLFFAIGSQLAIACALMISPMACCWAFNQPKEPSVLKNYR